MASRVFAVSSPISECLVYSDFSFKQYPTELQTAQ